ncbi:MAG: hypothetical protein Q4P15_13325 [Propionibacteriaceae bacterium]|nr:hypothetical protein [Propionibacteriaceae bacterium]
MASWTDGAAYAPLERPDGFATPEVPPLELAEPEPARTPGAMPTPSGFAPMERVTPLGEIRTTPPPNRNPSVPFMVSSGLLTAASSMGHDVVRDPRTPFPMAEVGASGPENLPPPTGAPLAPPTGAPLAPPSGMQMRTPVAYQGAPPQGTGPQFSQQQLVTERRFVFLALACAVIGLTIPAVAPWMLVGAGALTMRATRLTGKTGWWSLGLGLFLMMFGVLLGPDVYEGLSRLISLIFAVLFLVVAVRTYTNSR